MIAQKKWFSKILDLLILMIIMILFNLVEYLDDLSPRSKIQVGNSFDGDIYDDNYISFMISIILMIPT